MRKRITVNLPADLKSRARQVAKAEGRSLNALIEEGLRRILDRPDKPQTTTSPASPD